MKKTALLFFLFLLLCRTGFAQNLVTDALIPQPQQAEWKSGALPLPAELRVSIPEGNESLIPILKDAVARRWPTYNLSAAPDGTAMIRLHLTDRETPDRQEGYRLSVAADGIELSAKTPAGLFYGVQTLRNLIATAQKPELPFCEITDWPSLQIRGVFLNIGWLDSQGLPYLRQLIDLFASLKMNTLVLEFGTNLPALKDEFRRKNTLSEKEISELLAYARTLHFEIIPHLQTFSHVMWMSGHPHYAAMLENPDEAGKWNNNWCPSNSEVQQAVQRVIEATIAMVHPQYFHLGVDEIGLGSFGTCPKCANHPPHRLFGEQVERLTGMVEKHGIRPILYQDSLLPPDLAYCADKAQGEKFLPELSRNTIINVWDYAEAPSERSIRYFSDRGFQVLGATWVPRMRNNQELPRMISRIGKAGLGNILTFWHFMPGNITGFDTIGNLAFPGMVLAANYSWNTNAADLKDLPYDPTFEARRRLGSDPVAEHANRRWESVPLCDALNSDLSNAPGMPDFSPELLRTLCRELSELPEQFQLAEQSGHYYGIRLSGDASDKEPAGPVTIPVGVKTEGLAFLLTIAPTANFGINDQPEMVRKMPAVGNLTFTYEDGSTALLPLRYRWNAVDWNLPYGGFLMRFANRTCDSQNRLVQFSVIDWKNPYPQKQLKSVTLATAQYGGRAPVLLALSALEPDRKIPSCRHPFSQIISGCRRYDSPDRKPETFPMLEWKDVQQARPVADENFGASPKVKFIRNGKGGNFLVKLNIPPLRPGSNRGRIYIDFKTAGHGVGKGIRFSIQASNPEAVRKDALYLGTDDFSRFSVKYELMTRDRDSWQQVVLPIPSMVPEKGGISPERATLMRLSFWVDNAKPMTITITPPEWVNDERSLEKIYHTL